MAADGFVPNPDWPKIADLAERVWGKRNKTSTKTDIRFGKNDRISVSTEKHVWVDRVTGKGGPYKDLCLWALAEWPPPGCSPFKPNGHGDAAYGSASTPKKPPKITPVTEGEEEERRPPWANIGVIYPYRDESGTLILEVIRTADGKPRFSQRQPDPDRRSGWAYNLKGLPFEKRPIYRLPQMLRADKMTVYVVEGEKDADNMARIGLIATTNSGGSAKWHKAYNRFFAGRNVVILPDHDAAGEAHVVKVGGELHGVAASLRVLRLPGLSDGGDVSDWIEGGGTAEALERMAREAPAYVSPDAPPPGRPLPPTGGGGGGGDEVPVITCVAGELPRMAREAEAALIAAGVEIYQRHKLVRPIEEEYDAADGRKTHSAALLAFTPSSLLKLLSQVAIWQKYNRQQEAMVSVDPPDKLVGVLLDGRGDWTMPNVRGILTCPTLRKDGSVLATRGYDPASRYYLALPTNLVMPEMPAEPTRADAESSIKRLLGLLTKFPFVDKVSEAVALCILMTQVLRCGMECSPLLGVSANAPGSGKSYLVDVASAIALGRPCPVIPPGRNEEETEKGIRTKLLSGTPAFSVDNVHGGLSLPLLNQATERTLISIRLFSVLEEVEVENSVVIYMTGNNLQIIGDQGRRTMFCQIDVTGDIRPEFRTFDTNPIDTVMADRGRYIADILIVARAYLGFLAGGGKRPDIPPMGDSHKTWSRLVREPLVWLGHADPIQSQEISREADPVTGTLSAVIDAWFEAFGSVPQTVSDVVKFATTAPVLKHDRDETYDEQEINADAYKRAKERQEALLGVLRDGFAQGRDGVDAHKFGMWLGRYQGTQPVSGSRRFSRPKDADGKPLKRHGAVLWKLSK